MSKPDSRKKLRLNPTLAARITLLRDLTSGGYSIEELAERSGLSYKSVQEFTHHLHCVQPKVIHVEEWRETTHGYAIIPIYKWGNERDARRPPALTAAQRQQRYRDKKKKLKQQELLTLGRKDHG